MKRKIKPLIYVFCEGESEIAYTNCLKKKFADVAVIKKPVKGLFTEADSKFKKEARYRNSAELTDEIWFFFDVDHGQSGSYHRNYKIIQTLRKLRKHPEPVRVRLLMTTGCIEYWFLLHYEKTRPAVLSIAEKEKMEKQLKKHVPLYEKGDMDATREIASHMDMGVIHGEWALKQIEDIPVLEDNDIRNQWLYECTETFTTVQEAIQYLEKL